MWAALTGKKDVVEYLLEKGAEENVQCLKYQNAKSWAILMGNHDIARLLS